MKWDNLPDDIIRKILCIRREITCGNVAARRIQKQWYKYRTRVLIGRFHMLKYLKDFRIWNPTIDEFLSRSKL